MCTICGVVAVRNTSAHLCTKSVLNRCAVSEVFLGVQSPVQGWGRPNQAYSLGGCQSEVTCIGKSEPDENALEMFPYAAPPNGQECSGDALGSGLDSKLRCIQSGVKILTRIEVRECTHSPDKGREKKTQADRVS